MSEQHNELALRYGEPATPREPRLRTEATCGDAIRRDCFLVRTAIFSPEVYRLAQPVEGREPKQIEPGKRWQGPGGAYSSRVKKGDMNKVSDYLHRAGYLPGRSLDEVIRARVHSGYYRRRLAAESGARES